LHQGRTSKKKAYKNSPWLTIFELTGGRREYDTKLAGILAIAASLRSRGEGA
jgi:hypothetical protein